MSDRVIFDLKGQTLNQVFSKEHKYGDCYLGVDLVSN